MRNAKRFLSLVLFVQLSVLFLAAGECEIAKESRIFTTYPFSDPDPVPILTRKPFLYPCFSFDGFCTEGRDAAWTVIRLENDHVRVEVVPEAGGKIFGAIEKSTGREFVYRNDAMKFRQIALRGPWTSGGIELNFGVVGHAPSTATPVDYRMLKNADGSVSCVVGTIDLASRTRWSVIVTVPREGAFFETRTLWFNPTPFSQSYYVWMTSAVLAADDLQYFYPGRFSLGHGRSEIPEPWPVDREGRDVSLYRNNDFGSHKSYFVFGEYEHFFGGYWHESDFGFGHYALYDDMPGKKIWIWALSRQGAIWEQLLTDRHGQYSEPQAGRLLSQSDHEFFAPHGADRWKEVYFPFKEIGGLTKASPHAALNVERKEDSTRLGLCALQALDDDLVVLLGGEEIHRERLQLEPMESRTIDLPLPRSGGELCVEVEGKLFYCSDPAANDIKRPQGYQRLDESTPEGLYLSGEFLEKKRSRDAAMEKYRACLAGEKNHVRAMVRLAELHCRRAECDEALGYARQALILSPYDPDANHVYGVISRFRGDLVDAKETHGWAARSMKHRSNAYCQMAEISVLEGRLGLALEYAGRAIDFNRYNVTAHEVKAVVCRLSGQADRAGETLAALERFDPLNHLVPFERYRMDGSDALLKSFQAGFRSELPEEHYLEMALFYARLGLVDEAAEILALAPEHPIVLFWRAFFLRERDAGKSGLCLDKAASLSPRLVFPHRIETIPVLEWAADRRPGEWKPRYYLGLILWGKGRRAEARRLFESCGETGFAPLHLILAHMDGEGALPHLEKALAADEGEWRCWHSLIENHRGNARFDEALDLSRRGTARFPRSVVLAMDLAGSFYDGGRYEECLDVLAGRTVLPYEGSWEAHDLYLRAHVSLALESMKAGDYKAALDHFDRAREYPESLGTGKPFDPDFRLHDYLAALCCDKGGDAAGADRFRKSVLDFTRRMGTSRGGYHYFGMLALRDAGKEWEAVSLLGKLEGRSPKDFRNEWRRARFFEETGRAGAIEKKHRADARFRLVKKAVDLVETLE